MHHGLFPDSPLAAISEVWKSELKTASSNAEAQLAEEAQGSALAPLELTRDEADRFKLPFRPRDVYSQDTLRRARICPDCGFRTSSAGQCARCALSATRQA